MSNGVEECKNCEVYGTVQMIKYFMEDDTK